MLEEQEIAKIKQENPGVDDEAAQELYQTYLKTHLTKLRLNINKKLRKLILNWQMHRKLWVKNR